MNKFIFFFCMIFSFPIFASDVEEILTRLETKLENLETLEAEFKQTKRLSAFKQEIVLSGKIYMSKPNFFCWHTTAPIKYKMVMRDNQMKQWDEVSNQVQTFTLKGNPMIEVAIEQMRIWFSGQYKGLVDQYQISVDNQIPVILEFRPLENNITKKFIEKIIVSFREDEVYIEKIEMFESSGDSMKINFINTKINQTIDSKVWDV